MENERIKVAFVGHVDHGKSTLIGRLLYNTNTILKDKMKDIENASENGMDFAFLMDYFEEERQQGITIDTAQVFFRTTKREYVIIDAPGHVEFITNMITGASQADVAVLMVDAQEGIKEQTKCHAFLLSMLGIRQVIVAVNKMDLIAYEKERFYSITQHIGKYLTDLNIRQFFCVPISSVYGDNITALSEKTQWYYGKPFAELLDDIPPDTNINMSCFVFPVQDVYYTKFSDEKKRIAVGKVEAGTIRTGQLIKVLPSGETAEITSIEKLEGKQSSADYEECVGLTLSKPLFLERGYVICSDNKFINITKKFQASLFWMSKTALKVNERLAIRCSTQETSCVISKILGKIDTSSFKQNNQDLETLNKLEVGRVIIQIKNDLIISRIENIRALSRFVILRNNVIVGSGIISG